MVMETVGSLSFRILAGASTDCSRPNRYRGVYFTKLWH